MISFDDIYSFALVPERACRDLDDVNLISVLTFVHVTV